MRVWKLRIWDNMIVWCVSSTLKHSKLIWGNQLSLIRSLPGAKRSVFFFTNYGGSNLRLILHALWFNFGQTHNIFYCESKRSNGIIVLEVIFFFRQISTFYIRVFDAIFCINLRLNLKSYFYLWSIFIKFWEFKDCQYGQFGIINARYFSR